MPCYHPLTAWVDGVRSNGKKNIVFKKPYLPREELKLPCGQCIGCRLERSRQWAMRMVHESQMHEENAFITLTYDEKHKPSDGSLSVKEWQLFIRRLRRLMKRNYQGKKILYYGAGEYGEETYRPHYHAIIFGHGFMDRIPIKSNGDFDLFASGELSSLWPFGFSSVGDVTFKSAAYVARYVMKKVNGKRAENIEGIFGLSPYNRVDLTTGEYYEVLPEFSTMSLKPAIGKKWYEKYQGDCYPSDQVVVDGTPQRPPKYYDGLYPDIEAIKAKREKRAEQYAWNNTNARLRIRETIKMAQYDQLKRGL